MLLGMIVLGVVTFVALFAFVTPTTGIEPRVPGPEPRLER